MKKLHIAMTLTLCLTMLTACSSVGRQETLAAIASGPDPNDVQVVLAAAIKNKDTVSNRSILEPEYDYSTNKLLISELNNGKPVASYPFDVGQTPILIEKTNTGVVMLSNQKTANIKMTNGISIMSGDSSAEMLTCWQFDEGLNLLKKYELNHPELMKGLSGNVVAVSPDGEVLTYADGDSLYSYTLSTKKLKKINLKAEQKVYFEQIHYSASGKYLAFMGGLVDRSGTAYGSVNLISGISKTFFADKFSGMELSVNGEYAAIADTVLPNSMVVPLKQEVFSIWIWQSSRVNKLR